MDFYWLYENRLAQSESDWISFCLSRPESVLAESSEDENDVNDDDDAGGDHKKGTEKGASRQKRFAAMSDSEKLSFFDMLDGILRDTDAISLDFVDPRSKEVALNSLSDGSFNFARKSHDDRDYYDDDDDNGDDVKERFVTSRILVEKDSFLTSSLYHSKAPAMARGPADEFDRKTRFSEMIFKTLAGLFFSSGKYVPFLTECRNSLPPPDSGLDVWYCAFYKSFFPMPEIGRSKKKTTPAGVFRPREDANEHCASSDGIRKSEYSETTISEHVARLDFFFRFCDAMTCGPTATASEKKGDIDASVWRIDGKLVKPKDPSALTYEHAEWVRTFVVEAHERAFSDSRNRNVRKKVASNIPEDRRVFFGFERRIAYVLEPILRHIWGGAIVTYAYDESERNLAFERRYAGTESVSLETTTFAYFVRIGNVYNVLTRRVSSRPRPRSMVTVKESSRKSDVDRRGSTRSISETGVVEDGAPKKDPRGRRGVKISSSMEKISDVQVYRRLESDRTENETATTTTAKIDSPGVDAKWTSWPEEIVVYAVDMISNKKTRFDVPRFRGDSSFCEWKSLSAGNALFYELDFGNYDFDAPPKTACFWVFPPTAESKDGTAGFVCFDSNPYRRRPSVSLDSNGRGGKIVGYKNDFYYGKIDRATLDRITIVTEATESSLFYFGWFYNPDPSLKGEDIRFCDLEARMVEDFLNAVSPSRR